MMSPIQKAQYERDFYARLIAERVAEGLVVDLEYVVAYRQQRDEVRRLRDLAAGVVYPEPVSAVNR